MTAESKVSNSRIVDSVTLPSQGKIYEEEVNPEITLSSMQTKHELLRMSTTEDNQKLMADILDDCIVSEVGISSYDMCIGDYQYLLYNLRMITFGNEYKFMTPCPFCRSTNMIDMDLTELGVTEYDDELSAMRIITLPTTGTELELTLQTPRMIDKIQRETNQFKRRMKGSKENPYLLFSMLNSIVKKDGEDINTIEDEMWLRELPLMDTNKIIATIDKINSYLGYGTVVERSCTNCGEVVYFPFRLNDTFLRPPIL